MLQGLLRPRQMYWEHLSVLEVIGIKEGIDQVSFFKDSYSQPESCFGFCISNVQILTDKGTNGLCSGKKTIGSLIGSTSFIPKSSLPTPGSNTSMLTHTVFPLSTHTANT